MVRWLVRNICFILEDLYSKLCHHNGCDLVYVLPLAKHFNTKHKNRIVPYFVTLLQQLLWRLLHPILFHLYLLQLMHRHRIKNEKGQGVLF